MEYLLKYQVGNPVFVHGDLTRDNIIIDRAGNLYIIDFADAVLAPAEYELPALIFELFQRTRSDYKPCCA